MSLNGNLKRLFGLFFGNNACTRIKRSEGYLKRYRVWVQQPEIHQLLNGYFKAYHYQKAGIKCNYRVQLLQEPYRQGAILFYTPAIKQAHFYFLFDYLKQRVETLGYHLRSSDSRTFRHERYKQTTETYYLVPQPQSVPGTTLCNQLYGNLIIDLTSINRHPGYIRIITNTLADPHFSTPLPFLELFSELLQSTEK